MIDRLPYPDAAASICLDLPGAMRFTPDHDVKLILHLIGLVPGNVLEIGCNRGMTTREIALKFPNRRVYAVDCVRAPGGAEAAEQAGERPPLEMFCDRANDLANVEPRDVDSKLLDYSTLHGVRVVFIDGDHSFAGVARDTMNALHLLRNQSEPWLIIWHDCYDGAPAWCRVRDFVEVLGDEALLRGERLVRFDESWIAALGGGGALDSDPAF